MIRILYIRTFLSLVVIKSLRVCSTWQMKRVVLTRKHILFANVQESNVSDAIPFGQIMDVVEVDEDSYIPLTMEGDECIRALQIATAVDGYNCGRIYRFRPMEEESLKKSLLLAIRRNSLEDYQKKSCSRTVELFQRKMRAFFNSKPTQSALAFLTMSVSWTRNSITWKSGAYMLQFVGSNMVHELPLD